MVSFRIITVAILTFILGSYSQNAFAGDSGVLKLELQDAASSGMGGAFVGEADRPTAVYYNPAGITQIDTPEISAGVTFLQPQIEFKSTSANNGNTSQMKVDNYVFPDIFFISPLIKDKIYIGIGESSNYGSGNDWAANSFSSFNTVKDSVVNKDYQLALAYKITDQWSFGAAAIDDDSQFEHSQALNQSPYPINGDILFKATDNAWGYNLGTTFKLNDQNQFGIDYKSAIHHTYRGGIYFNNLYTGAGGLGQLLGGSSFNTTAIQKFTLPQSVTLGYSFKPTKKWLINFDLEWTDWSNYKRQTTSYPYLTSTEQNTLGQNAPQARDWNSVWSESIGAQYSVTDKFRVRLGYTHHQSPIPNATFDTEFPDSNYNALGSGFGI